MAKLWKVTAKKDSGKVVKGMSVEIAILDRSGEPRAKEIISAFHAKYSIEVSETRCNNSHFVIEKM